MRNFALLSYRLNTSYTFKIFTSTQELPETWNDIAFENAFLRTEYLGVLEHSAPTNMDCYFIGIFSDELLCGVAVSQFLDLSAVESFGARDHRFKTAIRNVIFKLLSPNVLLLGNNMLTGQNAFCFSPTMSAASGCEVLLDALAAIKEKIRKDGRSAQLVIFKDFDAATFRNFESDRFTGFYRFSTQPNMELEIPMDWTSFDDYLKNLQKKYRNQFSRSRKRAEGITKRKLELEEIIALTGRIDELYLTVAANAPFNTFYLPKNHFIEFKKQLKNDFLVYGYFENEKMIGFNTLIKNGNDIDTYFLGYDEEIQRDKMLYLNMLYDMVAYSVNQRFERIILARTALEIKSSVGAVPVPMYGLIRHRNPLLNAFMPRLFKFFEPDVKWIQRHPFK